MDTMNAPTAVTAAEDALRHLDPDEGNWPTGDQVDAIIDSTRNLLRAGVRRRPDTTNDFYAAAEQALAALDPDEGTWPTGDQIDVIVDAAVNHPN